MIKNFKILISVILLLECNANSSELKDLTLKEISENTSTFISNFIPGEGITEASVELKDDNKGNGNYQISILGVRDILNREDSNLFTQFSLHNQEINSDKRFIGNLGLGYRILNLDQTMMIGSNIFYDQDLEENHKRIGLGFEGKAAILDFGLNLYQKATNQKVISNSKEQVLNGQEYNLSSQLPYVPWTVFNLQGYRHENELASQDQKGNIYSLELALNPSLDFNIENDQSSVDGQDSQWNYKINFIYPPRKNKPTLIDGLVSEEMYENKNMKSELKSKVRRNNNLAVEIQGSVIFTSK